MSIFGSLFGKKDGGSHGGCCDMRIVEEPTCDCGGACDSASDSGDGTVVKVMGPGCKNCHQLHENALKAVERIGRPRASCPPRRSSSTGRSSPPARCFPLRRSRRCCDDESPSPLLQSEAARGDRHHCRGGRRPCGAPGRIDLGADGGFAIGYGGLAWMRYWLKPRL